jgi:hypothetical protein
MVARGPFVTRGATLNMRETAGRSSLITSGKISALRRAVFLGPSKNRRLERAGGYLPYDTGAPPGALAAGWTCRYNEGVEGSILLEARSPQR